MDGIYSGAYSMADRAVTAMRSAWEKTPNRETYSRVLWSYEHKRKCRGVEYNDSACPNWSPPTYVDEEIIRFIDSVPEEYRLLPESIRLLQTIKSDTI